MNVVKDILKKDIDRIIDGVIKADDASRIRQEVEEYVLTNSILKQVEDIVDDYLKSDTAVRKGKEPFPVNGVWISGYFGSGKSHLLKILAYLLDMQQEDELRQVFLSKLNNQFFKANLEKMLKIPSRTILFNIDQMSDGTQGKDENTILMIFEKALNKMQGFYHENRYIAAFERHLAEDGEYEAFKSSFEELNNESWQKSRAKVFGLGRSKLVKTLKEFKEWSEADARSLIDHYKNEGMLSVESFAVRVRDWIDSQEDPNFRVNFFIDEIGQFIANNTSLMLNLQTMAETLATVCSGRAWIFVTSQEDLDKVIGDPDANRQNDFTKITARFKKRISLSSGEVQEVIQKRLLEKTEAANESLQELFRREKENFRTIFSFRQGGKDIYFKERSAFVASYPFQAYQYYLLQQALRGLSKHNAFMGRHVSRGERSMLEIFQDVTKSMKNEPLYKWATVDRMFQGIRFTLKTELLDAINTAEQHLDNRIAIRLLKILLMVKYVRDFRSTVDHLTVLLIEDLNTDIPALTKAVEQALDQLVDQFYIERNGEVYQYLTNEEKDIEKEISNTPVDYAQMRSFYSDVVFQHILKSSKIRYSLIDEDYQFKKAVDDEQPKGTGFADLTIRLITALHPQSDDRNAVLNQSSGKKELLVCLDSDRRFYMDLLSYFRTDVYTRQNISSADSPQMERILGEKQHQNSERKKRLIEELTKICGRAELYVNGNELDIQTSAPADRIAKGFEKLITMAYPHLRMLKAHYTENSLSKILYPDDKNRLISGDGTPMGEDEQEMLNYILRRHGNSEPVNIASLQEAFTGGQYGWYPIAIVCVLAKLFMRNAVEVREGGSLKSTDELYAILSKNRDYRLYTVKPAPVIDTKELERFKQLYHDFFHVPSDSSVAKEIATSFREHLLNYVHNLEEIAAQKNRFSFLSALEPSIQAYRHLLDKEWSDSFRELLEREDELLTRKERIEDPITSFMEGEQHSIWADVLEYYQQHRENLAEMELIDELQQLETYVHSEAPYNGGVVNKAKRLVDGLKKDEVEYLHNLKEQKKAEIDHQLAALESIPEYNKIEVDQAEDILNRTKTAVYEKIDGAHNFSTVRDTASTYAPKQIAAAKQNIISTATPEKRVEYATEDELKIPLSKRDLITEEDVLQYVDKLKNHYLQIIRSGKRIGV